MKIKTIILFVLCSSLVQLIKAQSISSQPFTVGGDGNTFYPVLFSEANWYDGASEFELSRSSVHFDASWWGALIAKFRIHANVWGNGANFIDANINVNIKYFVADWRDVSTGNGSVDIVIWLRGQSTYYFRSTNSSMGLPTVYIGGYQEVNGPFLNPKTTVNPNVNQNGPTISGNQFVSGNGIFLSNVGIGTTDPKNKLDVNGTIHAREVKVDLIGWADFVFTPNYKLRPLTEVEQFIKTNGHLPEIPKAEDVQQNGVNLGEMQTKLLQKVEELTLYSIELEKKLTEQEKLKVKVAEQALENEKLKQKFSDYEREMKELKELLMEKHK